MGIPTLSRIRVGAAPVPPRKPSMAMISAPLRAMPLAMAATLWTAAIFTITGFLILRGLFEGIHQLPQVLDGVDVVMGCRGDGVRPLRNHPGAGHVPHNLGARQVAADARLGALAHFDLNSCSGLQIILVHAESPGGHLNNGMVDRSA